MVMVFYSHLGERPLKSLDTLYENYDFEGSVLDLIDLINDQHPGIKNLIHDADHNIFSSANIYLNIEYDDFRILDGVKTHKVKNIAEEKVEKEDNILISIYNPKKFSQLFKDTLLDPVIELDYSVPNRLEPQKLEFKCYIDDIVGPVEEKVRMFQTGESTLRDLMIPAGEGVEINFNDGNVIDGLFDRNNSRLIPEDLVNAIQKIWELDNLDSKLYNHQEDSLFYILGKLKNPETVSKEALLLAIPTGGGKTEAFLIPIISHIHEKKNILINNGSVPENKVNAVITYPTKALANDQANRIVEILYEANKNSGPLNQVTIGVFTGDTPPGPWDLRKTNIIQACPNPECQSSQFDYNIVDSEAGKRSVMVCHECGVELTFLILTRQDILNYPPDILITNLDMINFCLQSPNLRPLFQKKIDMMVFDEVHLCESVFGCHTAHLLRRLEAASGSKPLYIGVSATIGNAEELASLIFDVNKDDILYLNEEVRPYLTDITSHYRYHYVLTPHKWKDPDRYLQSVTVALNSVDMLGHAIRDPHFRKTIVFSNYRQDTDNLVKYLRDQEDRYFSTYKDEIHTKLEIKDKLNQTQKKIAEAIGGWYELIKVNGMLYNQNIEVGWHRGGLEQKERLRAITRFSSSRRMNYDAFSEEFPVDIMMATKTLELGIDIGDVSNVFNCSAPFTVNEYVQRAGRGGRKKDSIAVTVIDPSNPLDFYLKKEFEDYATPKNRKFEDAPIIITNESITEVHIYARILEFIAEDMLEHGKYKHAIKVEDLRDLEIENEGELVNFMEYPERVGDAIFEQMFTNNIIFDVNNNDETALESLKNWFAKENDVLDVKKVDLRPEYIKDLIIDKCVELRDKIESEEYSPYDYLSGMRSVDNALVPRMRGSGPVCSIKLIRDSGDEIKDHIPRRQAMTNMPKGGFATQGANTFQIVDIERDTKTEIKLRNTFSEKGQVFEFFKELYKDSFPKNVNSLDLRTPLNLKVRFYPFRFYCSKCGKTYTKVTEDDRCNECFAELRQLTEIYLCENCGEIFEPPVPKVCINPDHLEKEKKFMQSINSPMGPRPDYTLFNFRALPELNWQCKSCKATFNFHNKWTIDLPKSFMEKPFSNLSFENPIDIAKHYQYRPESVIHNKDNYLKKRFNPARYNCDNCDKYGTIKARNVPTVRSEILEFILFGNKLMENMEIKIGQLGFKYVDVISLSKEYTRKFYTKEKPGIRRSEVFPGDKNSFLANSFSTHAAQLNLNSSLIDDFVNSQTKCLTNSCESCEKIKKIPDSEITCPYPGLRDWEIDKNPDVRRKWCNIVKDQPCEIKDCEECNNFVRRDYLKYLLIHTLKHTLILSMPKYLGVSKNEIRGTIYPNNKQKPELIFLDVHEDGSGSVYLMKRNWERIWNLSEELLMNAVNGQGTLILPQFCERHNIDLCPFLALNFYEFVKNNS